jgi:hypothetical protein
MLRHQSRSRLAESFWPAAAIECSDTHFV